MLLIDDYVSSFSKHFPHQGSTQPWEVTLHLPEIINNLISSLNSDYHVNDGIAIHKTAIIETGVVIKAPAIISENCFIGAHAYLRGGVFLANSSKIGPGCEIKTSIIFCGSSVAHFNFIGDSIVGNNVNFEAGSIVANHYNEKTDKQISVNYNSGSINTGIEKFGALVGDNCKIGANAVLSPGTVLHPGFIVNRLELINQCK